MTARNSTTLQGSLETKKTLQQEMALFESTYHRGENLGKLFLILKNIAPTSVASEQSFSISGHIISV